MSTTVNYGNVTSGDFLFSSVVGVETDVGITQSFLGNANPPSFSTTSQADLVSGTDYGVNWSGALGIAVNAGSSINVDFQYNVTDQNPLLGISGLQQQFTPNTVSGNVTLQVVEYVYNSATEFDSTTLVGEITTNLTNVSNPPTFATDIPLNSVYNELHVDVQLQAVAGTGGGRISFSQVQQTFSEAPLPNGNNNGGGNPGTISGHIFNDVNANGVQATGDVNLAGVTVQLLDQNGNPITGETAVTDSNGYYIFSGLQAGTYEVAFTAPTGDHFSPVGSNANPAVDSVVNTGGDTAQIALAAGQNVINENAGVYAPATFTTHVYTDANADNSQDNGETNLAGVTVNLLTGTGAPTGQTAVTDSNGNVSFTGLTPGSYEVQVVTPSGDTVTQQTNVLTPNTLTAGSTANAIEGVYQPASFTTHVYYDSNADSTQEGGEANLAGVTVNLLTGTGASTGKSAVTDANGNVSFTGLVPGSYEIQVVTPNGDVVTQQTNVNTPNTLAPGGTANAIEGLYLPGTFTTHVYTDANADNVQDNGETNLAGVTVNLLTGAGVATGKTAVTDANGNVSFTGLVPGSYEVQVVTPTGDTVTQHTNVLTPTLVSPGGTANAIEGVYLPASFTTHVYLDANDDSLQDNGETNLPGVTVNLLTGTGGATGKSAVTDANGNVSFTGLVPGSYEVQVATPAGDVVTQHTNVGVANTLPPGGTANAIEGLYVPPQTGALSGHIFFDCNDNGVQNLPGDTNIAGVTVTLETSAGVPIAGKTLVTDSNGYYDFTGLTPGSYEVQFSAPSGDVFSPVGTNANAALDSIVNSSGRTPAATVIAGQTTPNQNAGVTKTGASIVVEKTPGCLTVAPSSCWNGTSYFAQDSFTFTVKNTGTVGLTNIQVVDNYGSSALPDDATPTPVDNWYGNNIGDTNNNGILDPGETWTYTATIIETGPLPTNPSTIPAFAITKVPTSAGSTFWLDASVSNYSTASGTSYAFKGITATVVTAGGTTYSYTLPDAYLSFSNSVHGFSTTYDPVQNAWITSAPANASVPKCFIDDLAIQVPSGVSFAGAKVTLSMAQATSTAGAAAPVWQFYESNQETESGSIPSNANSYSYCGYGNNGLITSGYSCSTGVNLSPLTGGSATDTVTVSAQTVCTTSGNGGCGGYGGCGGGGYGGCGGGYSSQSYNTCGQSQSSSGCNTGSGYQNGCYTNTSDCGYNYQQYGCDTTQSSGVPCTSTGSSCNTGSSSCTPVTVVGSASATIQVLTQSSSGITCGGTAPSGCLENNYGHADKLEFCYQPSDCVSQQALSSGLCSVSGHNGCSTAFVHVSDCSDAYSNSGQVCFEGTVSAGDKFYCDATTDLNNLPTPSSCDYFGASNGCLYVDIYASQADYDNHCAPVQVDCYNATGNCNNQIGDQSGSVKLCGYVGTSAHGYVC